MTTATIYHYDESVTLYHGDCLDVLATLPDASIAAIITDPPYGLEFMGQNWDAPWKPAGMNLGRVLADRPARPNPYLAARIEYGRGNRGESAAYGAWCRTWATACLRMLSPGGHLLAFGGTRTAHRLAAAIEDAGFEIRDSIAWLYGSGFPKSLNIARTISHTGTPTGDIARDTTDDITDDDAARTASRWRGWGTALKPAFEPIVLARKPLAGTVAATVTTYGTGALHIDACRVAFRDEHDEHESKTKNQHADFGTAPGGNTVYGDYSTVPRVNYDAPGRWPPNVLIDDAAADDLDQRSPVTRSRIGTPRCARPGHGWGLSATGAEYNDEGGPSRFFPRFPTPNPLAAVVPAWRYQPKAPTAERPRDANGIGHPTVKPVELMRWLVRLVTPPGGVVLDPFLGSAATAQACLIEGVRFVGIEKDQSYLDLALQRLSRPLQLDLFGAGLGDTTPDGHAHRAAYDGAASDGAGRDGTGRGGGAR
jgi:site-specific DNA-methyltransferase (adenine-specific)